MKILQIATPQHPTFAHYAVQNKKKAWIIERVPVMFFGLIPVKSDDGKGQETTVEPLVYNYQKAGCSIATSYKNFLGIDILTDPKQAHRDYGKELIAFVAEMDKLNVPASPVLDGTGQPTKKDGQQ